MLIHRSHLPRSLPLILGVFGLAFVSQMAASCSALADERKTPRHLTEARELLRHLDLKHTSYAHGEPEVRWEGTRISHADCSGFIDALLMHTYEYDREQFKRWFDSHRPSARRYHDAIVEERGFAQIHDLTQVQPGDIVAIKYLQKKENTGHVMLVNGPPRRMAAKHPLVAESLQWEIPVIDSSHSGHGTTDSRHHKGPAGKDHEGLGEGVFRIYTDRQNKILGFTWSTYERSEFKPPTEEHLVIGRLKPNFQP